MLELFFGIELSAIVAVECSRFINICTQTQDKNVRIDSMRVTFLNIDEFSLANTANTLSRPLSFDALLHFLVPIEKNVRYQTMESRLSVKILSTGNLTCVRIEERADKKWIDMTECALKER